VLKVTVWAVHDVPFVDKVDALGAAPDRHATHFLDHCLGIGDGSSITAQAACLLRW
jgi:hypothetical protein